MARKARLPGGWKASPADTSKVVALHAAGVSVTNLARRFGHSESWVRDQIDFVAAPSSSTSA